MKHNLPVQIARPWRTTVHITMRITLRIALILAILFSSQSFALLAQEGESEVDPAAQNLYIPLTGIRQLDVGVNFTCAVTLGGAVRCWGDNAVGKAGGGSSIGTVTYATVVPGLTSGMVQVGTGYFHACALNTAGAVKCWGANTYGQLGKDNDVGPEYAPRTVNELASGAKSLGVGSYHNCVITTANAVRCWGRNQLGQLGSGAADSAMHGTPVTVANLPGTPAKVVVGDTNSCVINTAGALYCWGDNGKGQLGTGGPSFSPAPVQSIGSGVTDVAVGAGTICAITSFGLYCAGDDSLGQLGNGPPLANSSTFVAAIDPSARTLAFAQGAFCALSESGALFCWGSNVQGQLGDGNILTYEPAPIAVADLANGVVSAAVGGQNSCAVLIAGNVKCWGTDDAGQLGNGPPFSNVLTPTDVLMAAVCYQLNFAHTGSGANPAAAATQSPGCPPNYFLPGASIALGAVPSANQRVQSWSAPVVANPGDQNVVVRMPSADTTVTVNYAACNVLTLSRSGAGGNPVAAPANSAGCAVGSFASGERIVLTAVPNANQRVKSWAGTTATPAVASQVNSLTMPNAAATVTVAYEACFALTTSVTGQGAAPSASPTVSDGCLTGGFAEGQNIALVANPAAGWKVKAWSGTLNDASTALTNATTMPGAAKSVGVIYEEQATTGQEVRVFLPTIGR